MLKIGVALAQWSFGENTKNSDDGTIGMGIFVKQMEVTDGLFFFLSFRFTRGIYSKESWSKDSESSRMHGDGLFWFS